MRKVKNERGATILMALLFLLLATMLGAVLLTAATGALCHQRSDRAAQQRYLTVSSAAELLRESVLTDSCTRVLTHTQYLDESGEMQTSLDEDFCPHTGLLAPWFNAGIDTFARSDRLQIGGCTDTITIDVPLEGGQIETVQAKLTMDATGTDEQTKLVIELSLRSAEDGAEDCRMTLTVHGSNTFARRSFTDDMETTVYTETTTTLRWTSAEITKGGADDA